jgi:GT2 family glycosyltransferase
VGQPLASILIVTWNGRALLERCLPAVMAQTIADREIVVVDNGSTDGSAELVATGWPGAILVRSATNRQFAGGNNLGLPRCRGQYVALLNNDCLPEPDWLAQALAVAERERTGMVATCQLRPAPAATIDSAGIALDRAAIAWDRGGGAADGSGRAAWPPLFGPSGGAALYSRALFEDVGPFDAELGMYYEDVDLAWRARLRGWGCAEAPLARATHVGAATAGANAPTKRFLLGRNKLWVAAKCYPGPALGRYLAAIVLYDLAAAVAYAAASPPAAVSGRARLAAVHGRLAAVQGLGRQLARRRQVQSRRTAPVDDVLAVMAPLAPPWRLAARFGHLAEAPI